MRFTKAMSTLGTAGSAGFSLGRPALRRQLLLTACSTLEELHELERRGPLAELRQESRYSWRAVLLPVRTSGSFHGENPFRPIATTGAGAFAALTLGRATPVSLTRFVRHGAGLAAKTAAAPGLITALSAGAPVTGNMTFSLWQSERDMLNFAYGEQPGGHLQTVRADRRTGILVEQVNARFRAIRIDGTWNPQTTLHPEALSQLAATLDEQAGSRAWTDRGAG